MTEPVKMADESPKRKVVDWEGVEREYRAGVKTLRQIADDYGLTHGAVNKRAKTEGWPRDLQAKIMAKAEQAVSKAAVSRNESMDTVDTKITEKQIVEANAQAIAFVDLSNRKDVQAAINVSRAQLEELATLADPAFAETLAMIGQVCKEEGRTDKVNETYHYIISLAGRVKMAKDIAASVGTYIPMQRKILKLDAETDKNLAGFDALLARVNGQSTE